MDASVVAKLLWPEPLSDAAAAVFEAVRAGRLDVAAPTLLPFEVANAVRYAERLYSDAERAEALAVFLGLQIRLVEPSRDVLGAALALALRRGVTVYDAAYYALAKDLGAQLLTADERFAKRVGGEGILLLSAERPPAS